MELAIPAHPDNTFDDTFSYDDISSWGNDPHGNDDRRGREDNETAFDADELDSTRRGIGTRRHSWADEQKELCWSYSFRQF